MSRVILVTCPCGELYVMEAGCSVCRFRERLAWWRARDEEIRNNQANRSVVTDRPVEMDLPELKTRQFGRG